MQCHVHSTVYSCQPLSFNNIKRKSYVGGKVYCQQAAGSCVGLKPQSKQRCALHTNILKAGSQICRAVEFNTTGSSTSSSGSGGSRSSSSSSSTAPQPVMVPSHPSEPSWQTGDILKATTIDGVDLYLEVVCTATDSQLANHQQQQQQQQQQQHLQVAYQGVLYTFEQTQQQLLLHPQGWQLQPDHPLVKALPGWPAVLQLQQSKQQMPQQSVQLQTATVVSSALQLQTAVQRNPAMWRDGTGPLDPPLTGLQYQTLAAGEIECLLNRTRGLVMVQLSVAWDTNAPQPVHNPLVLHNLQRTLQDPEVSVFLSPATGGLGLTAILCAKAEPWRSWAAHLVSFNAQAAVVAGSPYYKLLIGRMLGYKEENIRFHIQATDGRLQPTAEVIAAVDQDLRKLSKRKAQLPWTADMASPTGGSRRQQQLQSRAARKRR